MKTISYMEYLALVNNLDVSDEEILNYSSIKRGTSAFDFKIEPDPKKVNMSDHDLTVENALGFANGLARMRREGRFKNRVAADDARPILVSEGDSWFNFPLLIKDVIDQLGSTYTIKSLGAAGDTAQNMIYGQEKRKRKEFLLALKEQKSVVKAFLFSGAGNDIIGENPDTQKPVLIELLNEFNGDIEDVIGHINVEELNARIDFLEKAYTSLISEIRAEDGLKLLPIIIHGYDYAFPYPSSDADPRNPIYAKNDQWLGSAFRVKNIEHPKLQQEIIRALIDRLYDLLEKLTGQSESTGLWLVDCRGALPTVENWNDEIHANSDGFNVIASRFNTVLEKAIASQNV